MLKRIRAAIVAVATFSVLTLSGSAAGGETYIASLDSKFIPGTDSGSYMATLDTDRRQIGSHADEKLPSDFSTPVLAVPAPSAAALKSLQSVRESASLETMVADLKQQDSAAMDPQLDCLATAVYHEAKGEPLKGQLAVAQVIMNRVGSGRFADSICGVVYQPKQFSFHKVAPARRSPPAWATAVAVARIARDSAFRQIAPDALFFHATYVAPTWGALKQKVAAIGTHVFYR